MVSTVAAAVIALFAAGVGMLFVLHRIFTWKRNRDQWNEVREISPVIAAAIFPGDQFRRTLHVLSEREVIDWVHTHLWPIPSASAIQDVIDILVYDRILRRWPVAGLTEETVRHDRIRSYKYTFTKKGLRRFFPYWKYPKTTVDKKTAGVADDRSG